MRLAADVPPLDNEHNLERRGTVNYHEQRREQLAQHLSKEGVDALLVSSPVNVSYLTGFSGDSTYLVLARDRILLISDMRYTAQIAEECPGLEAHIRPPNRKLSEAVAEVLAKLGCRSVGFETAVMTVAELEGLRELAPAIDWKGAVDRVERLRMVKDPSEVAEVRAAIDVAERAFAAFRALLRPDDREIELYHAMENCVRQAGGMQTSFPPIIAVGERAALPHAPPTSRTAGSGGLILVDWGASGPFYKSDLTRILDARKTCPIATSGPPLEEVHAVVCRAQEAAFQAIRPGASGRDIDTAARSTIADAGYGDFFGHGLGHGVGLEIHEAPFLRPNTNVTIQAGMVFTIEPGIYVPGWGGVRIEDDVLVTPEGCEVLTHVPRDLSALQAFA
jgi:Xaa-Pro aminopeptidase